MADTSPFGVTTARLECPACASRSVELRSGAKFSDQARYQCVACLHIAKRWEFLIREVTL